MLGEDLTCPPCNVGPRSIPDYASLAQDAVHTLDSGEVVFAGQRNEGFYVDLGSIFDLGRPASVPDLHLIPTPNAPGVDATRGASVHTIALKIPKRMLTRDGSKPDGPGATRSRSSAYGHRRTGARRIVRDGDGDVMQAGPWVQVSRLGNPLFNEVIVPMSKKDYWNSLPPSSDERFLKNVQQPELAKLLPVLYPGVFPNLAGLHADRADLAAILLTGLPSGIIPGFQNFTGPAPADMLRLNMAIPPSSDPNIYGLLGGDLAGYPNGRRVQDDVVAIELRAIAGVTYPLIDPNYTPDGGRGSDHGRHDAEEQPVKFLERFPYMGVPISGYDVVPPDGRGRGGGAPDTRCRRGRRPGHRVRGRRPRRARDARAVGREVEVSPLDSPVTGTHAEVHERQAGGDARYAAVIDGLAEGEYQVWAGAPVPIGRVCIDAGGSPRSTGAAGCT